MNCRVLELMRPCHSPSLGGLEVTVWCHFRSGLLWLCVWDVSCQDHVYEYDDAVTKEVPVSGLSRVEAVSANPGIHLLVSSAAW